MSGSKKNNEELKLAQRRSCVDPSDPAMSIRRHCDLLNISRSGYYASLAPGMESEENEEIMKWLDRQYLETPFYGSRRMTLCLRRDGYEVNRKRVMRLMRKMGLVGQAPSFPPGLATDC